MAGLPCVARSPSSATGTSARTIGQYQAPSDAPALVKSVKFTFDDVAGSDPKVLCEVLKQTTAGTSTSGGAGTANGVNKLYAQHDEDPRGAFRHTFTSTDPTAGTIIDATLIARTGTYIWRPKEPFRLGMGERLAARCTTATNSVNCIAEFEIEE